MVECATSPSIEQSNKVDSKANASLQEITTWVNDIGKCFRFNEHRVVV